MDDVAKKGRAVGQADAQNAEQMQTRIRELEQALDEMTMRVEALSTPSDIGELIARVTTGHPWLKPGRQEERDRLLLALSRAPVTINILRGPQLVFDLVHTQTVRTLGARHIIGKPLLEALPELNDQRIPELLRRVLETGERVDAKEYLIRLDTDGSGELRDTFWDFSYLPLRDAEGRIEGVMTFDVDVTAQVLARRMLRQRDRDIRELLTRADAGVAQAQLDGRIILTNARHRLLFGWSDAELERARIEELVCDEESDNAERLRELVEAGTSFATKAKRERPDGSALWLHNCFSRIEDHEQRPHGLVAITLEGAAA
jgi:PAS domain S-box-containing protein